MKNRRPKGKGGSANDRPDGRTDQAGQIDPNLSRVPASRDGGRGMHGPRRDGHSDDLFWESEAARLSEVDDEDEAAMRVLRGVRRVEISSRRFVQEIFGGEYHSTFRGQGIEFAEVREYVPGDDVRLIDRNVSARMQHPYIKIFHEERELSVIFLVDQSGSTRFGSAGKTRAEIAAELVAVLAFSAISNNDKVGCCLFTETVEKWDPAETTEKIELMVGRDLQYIRLNGTVVGALAGLAIYAVAHALIPVGLS